MSSKASPATQPETSQWQRLLKNVGIWQGSFTQLSASGQVLSDEPTEVALIPTDDNQAMHQEVRFYDSFDYTGDPKVQAYDYRSLNRAILFFADGAFSQGSTQWGPFSEFGAELGLIHQDRRLRLVPLFDTSGEFKQLTLIREQRQGSHAAERAPLQVSDLIGTWQGEAVTQYADLRPKSVQATQLTIEQVSDQSLQQTIQLEYAPPISSIGTIAGDTISFSSGPQPTQVLCLPEGASATFPTRIVPRQPLFLEAGWLLTANTRQRIIRSYEASGAWVGLTLVTEHKI